MMMLAPFVLVFVMDRKDDFVLIEQKEKNAGVAASSINNDHYDDSTESFRESVFRSDLSSDGRDSFVPETYSDDLPPDVSIPAENDDSPSDTWLSLYSDWEIAAVDSFARAGSMDDFGSEGPCRLYFAVEGTTTQFNALGSAKLTGNAKSLSLNDTYSQIVFDKIQYSNVFMQATQALIDHCSDHLQTPRKTNI